MKTLVLFAIIVVATALTGILGTHVILELANIYSISFIQGFSFIQLYGLLSIVGIAAYKYEKSSKDATVNGMYKESFKKIITMNIFYLLSWGIGYIMFSILN